MTTKLGEINFKTSQSQNSSQGSILVLWAAAYTKLLDMSRLVETNYVSILGRLHTKTFHKERHILICF